MCDVSAMNEENIVLSESDVNLGDEITKREKSGQCWEITRLEAELIWLRG